MSLLFFSFCNAADGDFSAVSTQLTFSSTQTEHNVTVNIMEDLIAEGDESFLANLVLTSAPVQVTISPAQASVLITDNDGKQFYIIYAA